MIPDAALGSLLAATVAALVALLGLIISKENKTSEFRQAWIDSLRGDLSSYIAHVHNISGLFGFTAALHNISGPIGVPSQERIDIWSRSHADFLAVNRSATNIRLRLNPKEKHSRALLECLDVYEHLFKTNALTDTDKLYALERQLLAISQTLLKSEWKRVKHGEIVFQVARGSSLAVLVGAVVVLVWLFLGP